MKTIKLALHWQMGIALILGATLGFIFCDSYGVWGNVINGVGIPLITIIINIIILLISIGISINLYKNKEIKE